MKHLAEEIQIKSKRKIWIMSDPHYGHKNIVRGCSEWKEFEKGSSHQKLRDFDTLEEHNNAIVENINSLVAEDDELWHLGDWSFGGYRNIWEFRKRIKCKNIHSIHGNHDQHIENNRILDEDQAKETPYYATNKMVRMQDIFSSVQYYKELKLNMGSQKVHLIMSHFAMRVWNKSHHGSIMLFGHSHGSLKGYEKYKTMDVGVDTNNLKPYSLEQILDIMRSRENLVDIDHHNQNTN